MTTVRIQAGKRFVASIRTPGDKSISHRALLLAALANGSSIIRGLSDGEDVGRTKTIIQQLGASVVEHEGHVIVTGPEKGLRATSETLDCGNSGTTIRLLIGLVAGIPGLHHLDGDASLRRRPMDRVAVPLELMGVHVEGKGPTHTPPVTVAGIQHPRGISYHVPKASAQVKSAVLFAGLSATGNVVVTEDVRTRANTEEMLRQAGVSITSTDYRDGRSITMEPVRPKARDWFVPGDPSQAAFFVITGLLHQHGEVVIHPIYGGPERIGFLSVLERMGGDISRIPTAHGLEVRARTSALTGTSIHAHEIPSVDEVPALVVAACAATGTTRFIDMGELRIKESDRFAESVALARALGAHVDIDGDDFTVVGLGSARSFAPFSFGAPHDHRMAMSAAIAGFCGNGVEISGAESVATSFPNFFELLTSS